MNARAKVKEKTCQAPNCGKRFTPWNSLQKVCGISCAREIAPIILAKREKKERQAVTKHNRQARQRLKQNRHQYQFKLTVAVARRLANLLDEKLACVSCSRPRRVQFCGGHYLTMKAHPELAYDLRNIHGQCNRYCNCGNSGNINGNKTDHGYTQGLINRYGEEFIKWLTSYHSPKNHTCQDLIRIRAEMSAEIRRLQKGLPPSRDWRAIP